MRLLILISILCFSFQSHSESKSEYLVKIDKNLMSALSTTFSEGMEKVREDVVVLKLTPSQAEDLKADPGVAHISKNSPLYLFKSPDDLSSELWGMKNREKNGVSYDINVLSAWDITTGSKDVVVAVIDTGADMTHPDLVDNFWVNTAERDGTAGVDDDGNGYVDDINGYHFADKVSTPTDNIGHGTHVAGTIGARGNNGIGVVGVNWEVSLMILNMFPSNGQGQTDDAIRAIDYAVANGAKVINASWGGPAPKQGDTEAEKEYQLLYEAIQRAGEAGVTFVAASGNDSRNTDLTPMLPAAYNLDNIISVGSMKSSGRRSFFSNYGATTVDLMAPGSGILSTYPGGGTRTLSGTSMASPHVAGIVALMLSANQDLTPEQIKTNLLSTCVKNDSFAGKCVCEGHVDTAAAVQMSINN